MQIIALAVLIASLVAVSSAVPANKHALRPRQTYIITCIGGKCDDGSTPTATPKPTTSKKPEPPKTSSEVVITTSKKPDPPKTSSKIPDPPKTSSKITTSKAPDPPKTSTKPPTKTPSPPVQPTKTTTGEEVGPSSTRCPVPLYYKCGGWDGGSPWAGCTECVKGAKCQMENEWYYQCVADVAVLGGNETISGE